MSKNQEKRGTVPFVFAIILTVLVTVAVTFYATFFIMAVQGLIASAAGGELGDGLQAVFGIVLCMMAGGAIILLSPFAIGCSVGAKNRVIGKRRTVSLILLIWNIFCLSASVLSFLILFLSL